MILYTPASPARSVPVIDFSGAFSADASDRASVAQAIHRACRDTGFFYIANHGVAADLVGAAFDNTRQFFALPDADKMRLHMRLSPTNAGYEPIGGQQLDSQDETSEKSPPDLKESFYIGQDLPDDHPLARKRMRYYGHNQWPDGLPDFRPTMRAYHDAVKLLGHRVLAMLALSLELNEIWFEPHFDIPAANLRLIHYPPHRADAAFNQIGAGAHTDWGGVTILAQDDVGGLEVRNLAGEWIAAPPIPGAFVVNLGDLMARWTNGVYRSNMHRVINNRAPGKDRYSLAFFFGPRPDVRIEPMPGCCDKERPALFPACTAAEHMREMFERSYGYAPSTGTLT